MLQFPLSFRAPDDEAHYEIPFGVMARKRYQGDFGIHTRPNGDWPALNFVACHNAASDYWVTVANKGTPCYRVQDGVVKMTVVRSPCIAMASWDAQGAREPGVHVFEAMVFSSMGALKDVNPVRLGMEFNTPFLAVPAGSAAELPPEHSFLGHDNPSVVISAVKREEEGEDLIVRLYEPYGDQASATLEGIAPAQITETDLLERGPRQSGDMVFKPHEIKTVKVHRPQDQ
jgi:alpha-mannosidase